MKQIRTKLCGTIFNTVSEKGISSGGGKISKNALPNWILKDK
jgi:hypothetical protein